MKDEERDDLRAKKLLPYEPPAVEQDETFETLALACAKMTGPSCTAGGINS